MFDIAYDAPANILRVHVRDFWSPEDVTRFAGAVALALRDARRMRSDFDIIVESFDFPVQANHVADLLAGIKDAGMTATSGRAAVVVGSRLNQLQAERTLVHPRVRVFATMEAAEAWLATPA